MDQRINTLFTTGKTRELARAFRYLAKIAPPGYADWSAWAEGEQWPRKDLIYGWPSELAAGATKTIERATGLK